MTQVLVVGTCDPQFGRNQQIVRLLRKSDCNVQMSVHSIWDGDKTDAVQVGKVKLAVRAMTQYGKVIGSVIRAGVRRRPDVVFVLHPAQIDAVVIGVLCKVFRLPMVIDFFISLHETVVEDRALVAQKSLLGRVLKRFDRRAARLATHIIADTPEDKEYFASVTGTPQDKWSVVWVGANPNVYVPQPDVRSDEKIVLFYGTYIPLQGIEHIVRASALLPSQATMMLIGTGQERERIEAIVAKERLPVKLVDSVPEEELPDYIAKASVCLGVFGDGAKTARVIPNKVFQCLAMGKAVITGDTPAVQILDDAVKVVPVADAPAIARAVGELVDNPEICTQLGRKARGLYEELFNEEVLAGDIREIVINAITR